MCPIDAIRASARQMVVSGFYESHEPPPSGNVRSIVPPHHNGHRNGRWIIFLEETMISFGLALPESTNGQCVLVRLFVSRATFLLGFYVNGFRKILMSLKKTN